MKALAVKQPWAWLIVRGYKDIENRTWPTLERGRVLIHASQSFDGAGYSRVRSEHPDILMPKPHEYPRGGIVGSVEIVDCVTESKSKWFDGPFGYKLARARPLPFRRVRGQQRFFEAEPLGYEREKKE